VEEELVLACRNGDRSAYASLARAHTRTVFSICLGMLGNVHDAEDAAQESFVRGFSRVHELREDSRFRAWIVRIARNLCLDLLRRRKRGREVLSLHGAAGNSEARAGDAPHETALLRKEDRERLEKTLARLPEKYRVPLVLYYFDGHNTEDVARTLDLDPAGVLTRLSRGRRELRRMLQEQGGAE
jgi:RNA polymerase sigma-70 factor (ECF subfamily)